jgi:hypothetical protein
MKDGDARSLCDIAEDILQHWHKVHYTAIPYLSAMRYVKELGDKHGHDTGRDIVLRFLGGASTWKGDDARRIKAELRELLDMERLVDSVELTLGGKIKPKGPARHRGSQHKRSRGFG